MKRIPTEPAPPRTRLGGKLTLRGREFATAAALEQALAEATEDAGTTYTVRLTRRGRSLARALAAEASR